MTDRVHLLQTGRRNPGATDESEVLLAASCFGPVDQKLSSSPHSPPSNRLGPARRSTAYPDRVVVRLNDDPSHGPASGPALTSLFLDDVPGRRRHRRSS